MEAFFISTSIAEIGNKTPSPSSLVLAASYYQPLSIAVAILVATIINYDLNTLIGVSIADMSETQLMLWLPSVSWLSALTGALTSMMLINVLTVYLGDHIAVHFPQRLHRSVGK